MTNINFFYDGSPYHIETSPLNCKANQWTGFFMIGTSIIKELKHVNVKKRLYKKIIHSHFIVRLDHITRKDFDKNSVTNTQNKMSLFFKTPYFSPFLSNQSSNKNSFTIVYFYRQRFYMINWIWYYIECCIPFTCS